MLTARWPVDDSGSVSGGSVTVTVTCSSRWFDHLTCTVLVSRPRVKVFDIADEFGGLKRDTKTVRVRGPAPSNRICTARQRTVMLITVAVMTMAGNSDVHGATPSWLRPSESRAPYSGVGGCTPRPRKLNDDADGIAEATESVATTVKGRAMLGSAWWKTTATGPTPWTFACSAYPDSRARRTCERTNVPYEAAPAAPTANRVFTGPGPQGRHHEKGQQKIGEGEEDVDESLDDPTQTEGQIHREHAEYSARPRVSSISTV